MDGTGQTVRMPWLGRLEGRRGRDEKLGSNFRAKIPRSAISAFGQRGWLGGDEVLRPIGLV